MGDQHRRVELQVLDDGIQVAGLVGGGVGVASWLVGGAPAEEVEAHHPASGEFGHEPVVEVQVVGEPVHEHDRWFGARVVAGVQPVRAAGDMMLLVAGPAGGGSSDGAWRPVRFHSLLLRCSYTYSPCVSS